MKSTATAKKLVHPSALSLSDVERALGEKASKWAGRCFEIASRVVESGLVEGTAVYGHWLGEVHKKSLFYLKSSAGFVQHGWVVLPDRQHVFDPTRWAFEGRRPCLFYGAPGRLYDEGGDQFRKAMRDAPPEFDACEELYNITSEVMDSETWRWVEEYLGLSFEDEQEVGVICARQLLYLANAPLDKLGGHAAGVYRAIDKLDASALVPFDNYKRVKEGR
jgi:hypothetical protein